MTELNTALGLIDDQNNRIDEVLDQTASLISQAGAAINGFIVLNPFQFSNTFIGQDGFEPGAAPNTFVRRISPRDAPAAPDLTQPPEVALAKEELEVEFPDALNISSLFKHQAPNSPTERLKDAPNISTAGLASDVKIPQLSELPLLNLREVTIPDRPQVSIPEYNGTLPDFNESLPTLDQIEAKFKARYREQFEYLNNEADTRATRFVDLFYPSLSGIIEDAHEHIQNVILGLKTAWADSVETAIYNRRRSRTEAENRRLEAEIRRQTAARGADLELAVADALMRAEETSHNANVLAAFEVAEQRAERELRHLEAMLAAILSARDQAVNASIQHKNLIVAISADAINLARSVVGFLIDTANLLISKYNNVDLAKARLEIDIWRTRAEYALVDLEIHQAELRSAELELNVNQQRIDELRALIDLDIRKLEFAGRQIELARQKLEERKIPLEAFIAETQAYAQYINGKEVEASLFRTLMEADESKVRAQGTAVDQARARVALIQAVAGVRETNANIVQRNNATLADIYATELRKFFADHDIDVRNLAADIDTKRLDLDAFRTDLAARLDAYQTQFQARRTEAELNLEKDKVSVENRWRDVQLFQERIARIAEVNMEGARANAQMLSSLAASVNTLVSAVHETTAAE